MRGGEMPRRGISTGDHRWGVPSGATRKRGLQPRQEEAKIKAGWAARDMGGVARAGQVELLHPVPDKLREAPFGHPYPAVFGVQVKAAAAFAGAAVQGRAGILRVAGDPVLGVDGENDVPDVRVGAVEGVGGGLFDLGDVCGKMRAEGGYFWLLVKPCGDHHIFGSQQGVAGFNPIALPIYFLFNGSDTRLIPDWKMIAFDILLEAGYDFIPRHVPMRLIALILCAGQPEGPVGGQEVKGVPAIIAPCVPRLSSLFKNNMLAATLFQVVTGCQTGLSATDDNRF